MTTTKLSKSYLNSTTTTTTYEGRTEVDVRELLNRPNVKKLIQEVAKNTPIEPEQSSEGQDIAPRP